MLRRWVFFGLDFKSVVYVPAFVGSADEGQKVNLRNHSSVWYKHSGECVGIVRGEGTQLSL